MDDTTPTRNKQILSESSEAIDEAAGDIVSKPSVIQKGINGIKGAAAGVGNFSHMFVGGIASVLGIPSKVVSLLLATLMGTSSLALMSSSDTNTNSTAIRSEGVTHLEYVDHPNEQEAYFDTLTRLEKVDSAHKIYNYFKSLNYTDESIAGILSNIEAESGLLSDYYTGKEISLYKNDNSVDPKGMSGHKPAMYEAYYARNWDKYTVALYNEYKSGESYESRGISNYTRYQVCENSSDLDDSCLAVTNSETNKVVAYLPGFGLFQYAGDRASDFIHFVNCQKVFNDYSYDGINDQWISAPLQIAYLYFENKECEPGVRVNDWGTTNYYGKYGQKLIVDAMDTYYTHRFDSIYRDPENWRIAHCLNSMTSTGNVVYEYFTIMIDEESSESWKNNEDDCELEGLDNVKKHSVQEIKYTMKYKPVLYTFVVDKSKLASTTNKSNYNNDTYIKEINSQLKTLSSKDAIKYIQRIGGSSVDVKYDFLKDEDGNKLDYAGQFETTSYWKWENEDEETYENKAPDSTALRNAYAEWQNKITAYNNKAANLKTVYDGHQELKLRVGRWQYAEQLKTAQNNLYQFLTERMGNANYYHYAYDGIGFTNDSNHDGYFGDFAFGNSTNPNDYWISESRGARWNTLGDILNKIWDVRKVLGTTVSGYSSKYNVSYNYNSRSDTTFFPTTDSSEINRMLNNWCNVAQLTYSGNGLDRTYSCWSWSITDPGHSVGDDFERLVDVFNNRADWSYFYYALSDVRNAGATNDWVNFVIDPNPGFTTAWNYENEVIAYSGYDNTALNTAKSEWEAAARELDNAYNKLHAEYAKYEKEYNKFMNNRNEHNIHDIDYLRTSINGMYLNVGTNANPRQSVNGSSFYNNNALVRDDPKSFNTTWARGFDTYWYLHGNLLGTNTLAANYGSGVQSDPASSSGTLSVAGTPYTYTISKHDKNGNYTYILDGVDKYSKYKHRYKIYWKDEDYSYDSLGKTVTDEDFDVEYRELEGGAGKNNGYSGYLLTASYEFDHIMKIQAKPSNIYQDGEDIAFQDAIYFYENYLGYDHVDDPFAALKATGDTFAEFRSHCKRARYWYRIITNEGWAEQLDDDSLHNYKNEIFSHLPEDKYGKPISCSGDEVVDDIFDDEDVDKNFNLKYMSYWEDASAHELYNYQGNVFDNSSLASTAVSMSYPYGYNCYAVDDTFTKLIKGQDVLRDTVDIEHVNTSTAAYAGRRSTMMNLAVSSVVRMFAYAIDNTDSLAVDYAFSDIEKRITELCDERGIKWLEATSEVQKEIYEQVVSEKGSIFIRLNSPVISVASVIRASGRDDNFPGSLEELYPYLGMRERSDNPIKTYTENEITTDIKTIKERLTTRDEDDFDESKWSLLDLIRKTKKSSDTESDEVKTADGAGKWEVKGILTDGVTSGDNISYESLKPGDICVSATNIFIFVGTEASTKFIQYSELSQSKYAVCYSTCDLHSDAERMRLTYPNTYKGKPVPHQAISNIPQGVLSLCDGINATGLVCRELNDAGDDLYIKQLIEKASEDNHPYVVFRSINDDFEMSGYYKLLNTCDFRAYQDGRLQTPVTCVSSIPTSFGISNEQGLSSDSESSRSLLKRLSNLYTFTIDTDDDSESLSPFDIWLKIISKRRKS